MSELAWTGPDGFAEDGVVTYPPGFDAARGEKYPVVLLIHGGPGLSSQRDFVWEQWPLAQMIASRGYVVLQPNYRGSDNLGNAYMTAIVRNTVAGPSADILAGLAALERLPGIDASRVAVSGWSYGGELTSWLIGHDHRWRAAISGAAVNSEFDEYDLSTSNVQDRYPLGTSPYVGDGWRIYRDNSPITYYAQITTPTLIWGTTQDPVVPITQSYALFHALTDNHVPVRFAVFPGRHARAGQSAPNRRADPAVARLAGRAFCDEDLIRRGVSSVLEGMRRISAIALLLFLLAPAAAPASPPAPTERVVLAGGCFWGMQLVFESLKGVQNAVAGYAGGAAGTAQYEVVSTGTTGHAESVEVTFDPAKISFKQLLDVYFLVAHDPTQLNRQGPDDGTQYRSEIFYSTPQQRTEALAYIAHLERERVYPGRS